MTIISDQDIQKFLMNSRYCERPTPAHVQFQCGQASLTEKTPWKQAAYISGHLRLFLISCIVAFSPSFSRTVLPESREMVDWL